MAKPSWPVWMKKFVPTWLESLGYPETGIGDLTDLKFAVGIGDQGKWVGFINSGWYYFQNREQYNYVVKGTVTASAVSASGSVTEALSFRPSWGPVIVYSTQTSGLDLGPYIQHFNSFSPATPLTWSAVGNSVFKATLPASTLLVGMRDLTNLAMGSVAGSADLISTKLYWYDITNNEVYVKPTTTVPASVYVYADLVYNKPRLKFREIVTYETSGLLPSYRDIDTVVISKGPLTDTKTYHVSGYLTTALSGSLYEGDWVCLDYYIRQSFILPDHQTLEFYTSSVTGDLLNIDYETSIPDLIPSCSTLNGSGLNLNPLFSDSYRTGYIFHSEVASSNIWTPANLEIYADKHEFCYDWGEKIRLVLRIYEKNGLPIPWEPFTFTYTANGVPSSISSTTDGRGEYNYIYSPATGVSAVSFYASALGVTGGTSMTANASSVYFNSSKYASGFVSLVVTPEKNSRGLLRSYLSLAQLDGIPTRGTVTLKSKTLANMELGDQLATGSLVITTSQSATNPTGLVEFGYDPVGRDAIFGFMGLGQSNIMEVDNGQ